MTDTEHPGTGRETLPECTHEDGHAWVVGRPVFESEDAERVPENVAYNTRQCRRCGYHDEKGPREDGSNEHDGRRGMWDPDRVVTAEELLDRQLTNEEIQALEYHEPLPDSLPEEVKDRV